MPSRQFTIALVNRLSFIERERLYFEYQVQNEITYTLWHYLTEISQRRPRDSKIIPAPGWYFKASDLKAYDVVVYFVSDISHSIGRRAGALRVSDTAGGATAESPHGIVSEVYVESMAGTRSFGLALANMTFHEVLHNKLDTGLSVVSDIHSAGGGGLALADITAQSKLSSANATLMARHMFKTVR